MRFLCSILIATFSRLVSGLAPSGPWDAFNFAPKSRTVYPNDIYGVEGSVKNAQSLVSNVGSATFSGNGSFVTLDYGVEVLSCFLEGSSQSNQISTGGRPYIDEF